MAKFLETRPLAAAKGNPPREFVTAQKRITVAQMLAIGAAAITLVPAPGVGKTIVPIFMVIKSTGGTAYEALSGALGIFYGTDRLSPAFQLDKIQEYNDPFITTVYPDDLINCLENKPLVLSKDGDGEMTGGDYPLDISVEYEIIETG